MELRVQYFVVGHDPVRGCLRLSAVLCKVSSKVSHSMSEITSAEEVDAGGEKDLEVFVCGLSRASKPPPWLLRILTLPDFPRPAVQPVDDLLVAATCLVKPALEHSSVKHFSCCRSTLNTTHRLSLNFGAQAASFGPSDTPQRRPKARF
ncbi:hypothetical protein G7046_g8065 [Stylonectria norvegica]|nr:hypothetical protein G7046_g8065 [Stylonectria norvegica]